MKRLPSAIVLLLAFTAISLPARAQDGEWALSVGFPVSFKFSEDENTGATTPAKSPAGFRFNVTTPVNLSVGLGHYESGFDEGADPFWFDRDITYSFLEIGFVIPVDPLWFAIGFGLGEAEFTPERVTIIANFTQDIPAADAQEWFVMAAYMITDQWDVQLGFHALKADVEVQITGQPLTAGDVGATMTTLGAGYHF